MTNGQQLAAAIMPFMTSRHTASREELTRMVAKPVDRLSEDYEGLIKVLMEFIETGKTTLNGLTYSRGVNESSFLSAIQKLIH